MRKISSALGTAPARRLEDGAWTSAVDVQLAIPAVGVVPEGCRSKRRDAAVDVRPAHTFKGHTPANDNSQEETTAQNVQTHAD